MSDLDNRSKKKQKIDFECTINSDITITPKLNEYLFNLISIHLIKNEPIQRVLELSLLSKSTFKTIQNLIISYEFNSSYQFIISLNQLIQYIKNSTTTTTTTTTINQDNYKFKLIQYKEIESIKLPIITNNEEDHKLMANYSYDQNKNIETKEFLNEFCPNLKYIVITTKVYCKFNIEYDFSCNGFFVIEKLVARWDDEGLPFNNEEEEGFDWDLDLFSEVPYHEFSFSYLSKFNPSKLYISSFKSPEEMHLSMVNLKNIFNCKSITSYSFKCHNTPTRFFTSALENSKSVTSLSVSLKDKSSSDNNECNDGGDDEEGDKNCEDGNDDGEDGDDDGEEKYNYKEKQIQVSKLLKHIGSNKTLKKLKFNRFFKNDGSSIELIELQSKQDSLIDIFNSLKENKSIEKLGLYGYNIIDESILTPLINQKNIQTLYILIKDNQNLTTILNHLNVNANIKKLHLQIIIKDTEELNETFLNYFNNNKSSLSLLIIKYYREIIKSNTTLQNQKHKQDFKIEIQSHKIINILKNSKSNSKINLKLKSN